MKKEKHDYGYYRKIRQGLDKGELVEVFGAKRANKVVRFVREVCEIENAAYHSLLEENVLSLRFWCVSYDEGVGKGYYLFDISIDQHTTNIFDNADVNMSFIDIFGDDLGDAVHAIKTGDVWSSTCEKLHIMNTLNNFATMFVPETYETTIVQEYEGLYKMHIDQLTIKVTETGITMEPIPVLNDNNEQEYMPVMIACNPFDMTSEEIIQALAELFGLAAAIGEITSEEK